MLIGYARVSTGEQNLELQEDALSKAGCEKIYSDTASGMKSDRPGLATLLKFIRPHDVLVVWRLDRLGRSLSHLLQTVNQLAERQIGFKSLSEAIDTTTSGGVLVLQIFGAIAEFERNLMRERTRAGLNSARARGRLGGRPKTLNPKKVALMRKLYDEKQHTVQEICDIIGVTKPCLYDYIKNRHKVKLPEATI